MIKTMDKKQHPDTSPDTLSLEQGNAIIRYFDGWRFVKWCFEGTEHQVPYFEKWENGVKVHDGIAHYPEYHNNWNLLMPVVEKIRNDHFVNIEMYGDFVCVWITKDKDLPKPEQKIYSQDNDPIKATWGAVIQFIQWYNTTLTNKPETK